MFFFYTKEEIAVNLIFFSLDVIFVALRFKARSLNTEVLYRKNDWMILAALVNICSLSQKSFKKTILMVYPRL